MPPAAVLLDLYDTLVHGDWQGLRDGLAAGLGVEPRLIDQAYATTRHLRNTGGYGSVEGDMTALIDALGLEPTPELVRDMASLEHGLLRERIRLYPESLDVVHTLHERGVTTVLVSNCSHSTRAVVDRLALGDVFDHVLLSFEAGARKPQPSIYQAALQAAGGRAPEEALFVDDQVLYCDGAAALGIATRLILREGAEPSEGFAPTTNDHEVIRDLGALLEI
jgi:HAD superfamily hydrolase (TIGR01509 family)